MMTAPTIIPPYITEHDGRHVHLSQAERARQLKREGETWVTLDQLAEMLLEGWRPVEFLWHSQDGSWRGKMGGAVTHRERAQR
jgi:hypothetical protein